MKKNSFYIAFSALLTGMLLLSSCGGGSTNGSGSGNLSVTPKEHIFRFNDASEKTSVVKSDDAWSFENDSEEWVTVKKNNNTLMFSVKTFDQEGKERKANITIKNGVDGDQLVKITQRGPGSGPAPESKNIIGKWACSPQEMQLLVPDDHQNKKDFSMDLDQFMETDENNITFVTGKGFTGSPVPFYQNVSLLFSVYEGKAIDFASYKIGSAQFGPSGGPTVTRDIYQFVCYQVPVSETEIELFIVNLTDDQGVGPYFPLQWDGFDHVLEFPSKITDNEQIERELFLMVASYEDGKIVNLLSDGYIGLQMTKTKGAGSITKVPYEMSETQKILQNVVRDLPVQGSFTPANHLMPYDGSKTLKLKLN